MATVIEASGNAPVGVVGAENKLTSISIFNAGDPTGSVTPNFVGELLFDTTNEITYRATGITNATWTRAKDA